MALELRCPGIVAANRSVAAVSIAELRVAGFARVTAIEPCPWIASDEGSVITGSLCHPSSQNHRPSRDSRRLRFD